MVRLTLLIHNLGVFVQLIRTNHVYLHVVLTITVTLNELLLHINMACSYLLLDKYFQILKNNVEKILKYYQY
jgi:hypothetical protein